MAKKQLATTYDERLIKALKITAVRNDLNVNEVIEAIVLNAYINKRVIDDIDDYKLNKDKLFELFNKKLEKQK